ncbi:MAG: tetratricopeptide repeat protein [Deferribacterales bacterium]|nr:tetratricopeptide repeat protein [Deferribacterales bacterium]
MNKLHNGIDLYLTGDLYAAAKVLKEHINEGGPSAGTAYYHLGMIYCDRQKLTEACEYFTKAVELEPDKSMYHYRLGVVYSRLMMLDFAIKELQRSIDLNPEHQRSRFILGTIHFQQGDMEKAYEVFTALIKTSPDFADAYYHRGLTLYHMGNNDLCRADFEKALELNPNYDEARSRLALMYLNSKDYDKSSLLYMQIYNNGARDCVFLQHLVKSLILAGDLDKAGEIVSEALILYPHNPELQKLSEMKGS